MLAMTCGEDQLEGDARDGEIFTRAGRRAAVRVAVITMIEDYVGRWVDGCGGRLCYCRMACYGLTTAVSIPSDRIIPNFVDVDLLLGIRKDVCIPTTTLGV